MKKGISILLLILGIWSTGIAQPSIKDSLVYELAIAKHDSNRVLILSDICKYFRNRNTDSSSVYGQQALKLAQQINFSKGEVLARNNLGTTIWLRGDIPDALKLKFKGLQISEKNHFLYGTALCLNGIGVIYGRGLNDQIKALEYYYKAMSFMGILKPNEDASKLKRSINLNIGISYTQINQFDSAQIYLQHAIKASSLSITMHPVTMMFMGELQFRSGNRQPAMEYLQKSIQLFMQNNQGRAISEACNIYAGFFKEMNAPDSVIYYSKRGLEWAQAIGYKQEMLVACNLLAEEYELTDIKEANKYLKMAKAVNEELYGAGKVQSLQKLISEEQERQRKAEIENIAIQNRVQRLWIFSISGALISLIILLFILYRNNKNKQKANIKLKKQKEEIQDTLTQLKSTQTQLIQSEKMASLGELTAGIAHEIQNPLNFVNNFSEVNTELATEIKDEISNGNSEDAILIADDIIENQKKINHHGKRAEAIVKGMLQHSRPSTGQKELTDINKLADEYLRLSYHGLRAKDKSFNADFKLEADESLPKINVIPQDIGRVLLNLINNAFYAVDKKAKEMPPQPPKGGGESPQSQYKPVVLVSTLLFTPPSGGRGVEIRVKDNGPGISSEIKDKIFQPFFTTKPTGSGTGLGLSLSYDIVRAHGGEITVESVENEGTKFIIQLPLKT